MAAGIPILESWIYQLQNKYVFCPLMPRNTKLTIVNIPKESQRSPPRHSIFGVCKPLINSIQKRYSFLVYRPYSNRQSSIQLYTCISLPQTDRNPTQPTVEALYIPLPVISQ